MNANLLKKKSLCTACGADLDAATCALKGKGSNGLPKKDDATVCLYCGNLMAFMEDLTLRELTPEERTQMSRDPRIAKIMTARAEVMAKRTH